MEKNQKNKQEKPEALSPDDIKIAQKVATAQLDAQLKQLTSTINEVMELDIASFTRKYIADSRFELFLKIKNAQAFEQIAYELHAANNPAKDSTPEEESVDEEVDGDVE